MHTMIQFLKAGSKALESAEAGRRIPFTCPLCQKQALAGKNKYNGHLFLYCPSCRTMLRQ